jgi:hypothetical protein
MQNVWQSAKEFWAKISKNIAKTPNLSYFQNMNSLEFTAKIEHGVIHLPKEFEEYENAVARVTVEIETPTTFKKTQTEIDWQERNEKFQKALRWIEENRAEFLGKWVCLDGENLIASGDDAKKVYTEAKAKGIKIPFIEQVREEENSAYWGGWD